MSYFGEELKHKLNRNKAQGKALASGKELAKRTGKSQSQMSRWCSGAQEFIDKDDLALIASTVATSTRDQAELIAAAMKDLGNVPNLPAASRMISVHVGDSPVRLESLDVQVPASRRATYNILARAEAHNPNLRGILDHLAEIFKET